MHLRNVVFIALLSCSQAMLLVAAAEAAMQGPASNFDLFKGPQATIPPPTGNANSLPTVGARSVGLINNSTSTMYFASGDVPFNVPAGNARIIDLPSGQNTLTLEYSIKGQKKTLALAPGRYHSLQIDAATSQIVDR